MSEVPIELPVISEVDKMPSGRLLMFVFNLDADDPITHVSHTWAQGLAERCAHVSVVAGRVGRTVLPSNVSIFEVGWKAGQHAFNSGRLWATTRRALKTEAYDSAFTHMAAPYLTVVSPLLAARRMRSVLWYAHSHPSRWLRLSVPLVDVILTSVPEACLIDSGKVRIVGQGVGDSWFSPPKALPEPPRRFVHWGRADPVKRLDVIVDAVYSLRTLGIYDASFLHVGSPSTMTNASAWERSVKRARSKLGSGFSWSPSVSPQELRKIAGAHHAFLHACLSSLDKAPLEAAALGLPVLSDSSTVTREVGVGMDRTPLARGLQEFCSMTAADRYAMAVAQHIFVARNHGISTLLDRVTTALFPGQSP